MVQSIEIYIFHENNVNNQLLDFFIQGVAKFTYSKSGVL
jgi:hypothetical protein